MQGILDFLSGIATLIMNVIQGVLWIVVELPKFIATLNIGVAAVPSPIVGFVVLGITLTALFAVLRAI